jgi:tetratricopeptide (TPR) repeat protein
MIGAIPPMHRRLTSVVVFCMCLLPSFQSLAEEPEFRRLPFTTLDIIRIDWRRFPDLTLECLAIRQGRVFDLCRMANTPAITENAVACSLVACHKPDHPTPLTAVMFLALSELEVEEVTALQTAIRSTLDSCGQSFVPRFFIPRESHWVQVDLEDIDKLQFDSIPPPAWSPVLLQKMAAQIRAGAPRGNDLTILVASKVSQQMLDMCSGAMDHGKQVVHRIGILARDADLSHSALQRMSQCEFVAQLDVEAPLLAQTLQTIVRENIAAQCALRFVTPMGHMRYAERVFRVCIDDGAGILEGVYSEAIPDSVIQTASRRWHEDKAVELGRKRLFAEASDTLWCAYTLLNDQDIREFAAKNLFQAWREQLRESGCTSAERNDLLRHGDDVWHFSAEDPWYQKLEIEILDSLLHGPPSSNESIPERLALLKRLAALLSEKARQAETFALIGDLEYQCGNFWSAADDYSRSLQRSHSSILADRQRRAVEEAIASDFVAGRFSDLYKNGLGYQKSVGESFPHRYMFAVGCMQSGDFARARTEFEWLTFNWNRNQNLVSWEDALANLQGLYERTLQFEHAFRLAQRLYRQRTDDALLRKALRDLRARFLAPIAMAFPAMMERVGRGGLGPFFEKKNVVIWPHFLSSFFCVDSRGRTTHVAGTRSVAKLDLSQSRRMGTEASIVETRGAESVDRLCQRAGDGFFVLESTGRINETESVMLAAIRQAKSQDQPWTRLIEYEQTIGVRLLSELFSAMITAELRVCGHCDIRRYWEAVGDGSGVIRYMVFHGHEGRVLQSCGFDSTQMVYARGLWRQSSNTRAYFCQAATCQQKPVLDLANPIYIDAAWRGAARIGVVKVE